MIVKDWGLLPDSYVLVRQSSATSQLLAMKSIFRTMLAEGGTKVCLMRIVKSSRGSVDLPFVLIHHSLHTSSLEALAVVYTRD